MINTDKIMKIELHDCNDDEEQRMLEENDIRQNLTTFEICEFEFDDQSTTAEFAGYTRMQTTCYIIARQE